MSARVPLTILAILAALGGASALDAPDPEPAVPVVGAWWAWVTPVAVVPQGTAVLWVADTKHTVTTADSLEDALAGMANDRHNADDDPDTFDVELFGGPLSETFRHAQAFQAAGEKPYFCRYHVGVGMVGVVSVVGTA